MKRLENTFTARSYIKEPPFLPQFHFSPTSLNLYRLTQIIRPHQRSQNL